MPRKMYGEIRQTIDPKALSREIEIRPGTVAYFVPEYESVENFLKHVFSLLSEVRRIEFRAAIVELFMEFYKRFYAPDSQETSFPGEPEAVILFHLIAHTNAGDQLKMAISNVRKIVDLSHVHGRFC